VSSAFHPPVGAADGKEKEESLVVQSTLPQMASELSSRVNTLGSGKSVCEDDPEERTNMAGSGNCN
jgi:hypothetical protein